MARMSSNGIGDIVPAQLQNAPDYSPSAQLFMQTLASLSDGASYYNPAQAAQANPLNVTGPSGSTAGPAPSASTVPMPTATTAGMPSITAPGTGPATGVPNPYGQPSPFNQPLPTIVDTTPSVIGCSASGFSQWVSNNPVLALGALAVIAYFALGMNKGKG